MFQYNLKSLLGAMLAVCVLTWLLFVLPGEIGVVLLTCLFVMLPSAVIAGILYFRGYPQAFAIGCVPPLLIIGGVFLFEGPPWRFGPGDEVEMKIAILVCNLLVCGGGAAAAGVRWLAVWSQPTTAQAKTFPGLPLDLGPPNSERATTARAASHPLNPEP